MLVENKTDLIEAINAAASELRLKGVSRIGVFGSFARDEARPDSDVDFYVEFFSEKKTFKNFMTVADILENITGRKVELVTPQSLNQFTAKYILSEVEYVTLAA